MSHPIDKRRSFGPSASMQVNPNAFDRNNLRPVNTDKPFVPEKPQQFTNTARPQDKPCIPEKPPQFADRAKPTIPDKPVNNANVNLLKPLNPVDKQDNRSISPQSRRAVPPPPNNPISLTNTQSAGNIIKANNTNASNNNNIMKSNTVSNNVNMFNNNISNNNNNAGPINNNKFTSNNNFNNNNTNNSTNNNIKPTNTVVNNTPNTVVANKTDNNTTQNNTPNPNNSNRHSQKGLSSPESEIIVRNFIYKFEKEFPWFAKGWEKENEAKRKEFINNLVLLHSGGGGTAVPSEPHAVAETIPIVSSPYLHMSIKEKWAKTDSNLSVTFTPERMKALMGLVAPFQDVVTSFITSTYRAVNVQVNIFGASITNRRDAMPSILANIVSLIKNIIEHITEEGNCSVQLVNDMHKKILEKISNTVFEGKPKDHIITAATEYHNPKYVNKLVIIRLNTILSRLRSLTVQIANIISGMDQENFIVDHKTILEVLSCIRLTTTTVKKASDQLATSVSLQSLINQKSKETVSASKPKKSVFSKFVSSSKDTPGPDNIYNFNASQSKNENWEDGAGNLNSLVLKLTSTESIDQTFMKSFITTYPSFTTAEALLSKCLERYNVPKSFPPEEKMQIQLRVCIVFKYWIENKIKDFDENLISQLIDFTEQLKSDGHIDVSKMLKTTLDKYLDKINEAAVIEIPKIEVFEIRWSPSDMLMNSSEKDIAEQITLISWRMYKDIDVNELLKLAWTKKQTRHRSPNIKAFIKRFNHVSFWVATMILVNERLKDRSKVITKFIGIAQELRKLNNFDGLMYIISGLRNSAVDRLKFSKFTVNETLLTAFDELADTMNPQQSWKAYRDILRTCGLPAIPFMGVYCTDLTFIEDGNPDTYRDGELINFNKRQMVYKVLQEVLLYQTVAYQIEPKEPLLSYLTQMPFLEESDLYYLSSQREPRGCTIKDLL